MDSTSIIVNALVLGLQANQQRTLGGFASSFFRRFLEDCAYRFGPRGWLQPLEDDPYEAWYVEMAARRIAKTLATRPAADWDDLVTEALLLLVLLDRSINAPGSVNPIVVSGTGDQPSVYTFANLDLSADLRFVPTFRRGASSEWHIGGSVSASGASYWADSAPTGSANTMGDAGLPGEPTTDLPDDEEASAS